MDSLHLFPPVLGAAAFLFLKDYADQELLSLIEGSLFPANDFSAIFVSQNSDYKLLANEGKSTLMMIISL